MTTLEIGGNWLGKYQQGLGGQGTSEGCQVLSHAREQAAWVADTYFDIDKERMQTSPLHSRVWIWRTKHMGMRWKSEKPGLSVRAVAPGISWDFLCENVVLVVALRRPWGVCVDYNDRRSGGSMWEVELSLHCLLLTRPSGWPLQVSWRLFPPKSEHLSSRSCLECNQHPQLNDFCDISDYTSFWASFKERMCREKGGCGKGR